MPGGGTFGVEDSVFGSLLAAFSVAGSFLGDLCDALLFAVFCDAVLLAALAGFCCCRRCRRAAASAGCVQSMVHGGDLI